jgi:hypothetical protein
VIVVEDDLEISRRKHFEKVCSNKDLFTEIELHDVLVNIDLKGEELSALFPRGIQLARC